MGVIQILLKLVIKNTSGGWTFTNICLNVTQNFDFRAVFIHTCTHTMFTHVQNGLKALLFLDSVH